MCETGIRSNVCIKRTQMTSIKVFSGGGMYICNDNLQKKITSSVFIYGYQMIVFRDTVWVKKITPATWLCRIVSEVRSFSRKEESLCQKSKFACMYVPRYAHLCLRFQGQPFI
jgi:hypothetical protein